MAEDKIVPLPPRLPKIEGQTDLPEPNLPSTTAGHLSHSAAYVRSEVDGFDSAPGLGEFLDNLDGSAGATQGPVRTRLGSVPVATLPEPEMRPPIFLSPFEAMKDIYMQTRGRSTRRTDELLEGPDLEDLLATLETLFDNETLMRHAEAKVARPILKALGEDMGPLLGGLGDPRLTEPWRLLVDGWDIWAPEDAEEGVDLFWEGEGENEDGSALPILQSLQYSQGEITLHTQVGEVEDRLTFDGAAFYRLKTPRTTERSD